MLACNTGCQYIMENAFKQFNDIGVILSLKQGITVRYDDNFFIRVIFVYVVSRLLLLINKVSNMVWIRDDLTYNLTIIRLIF
ncbi:hypothetical protein SOASR032_14430 [Pragia fontium]|uniref:Uncharacterized protein n=1 Tax=Pragia fontium TaxID=82985 RepID=A0ABQ5LH32_9GAMM|nr:hypothetical protein QQ39_03905 [Pragia fontium]GKX62874.1 hypothetical protein SOASR032_14430 [Pragia fontium]